jgi:phage terminase large subunit-like protein
MMTCLPARTKARSRADRVIAFIHQYCRVPSGAKVGKPLRLLPFQERFIRAVYDNPAGTSRAYLSIARKNGKTATIACLVLAHLVGPEARLNSQIISGARSREQAGLVFDLAEKMVYLNPDLAKLVRSIPSKKTLMGLPMNVEFKAISAEAGTAHGLSPVLAILDEVGQVKGMTDAFIEAIETAQGAHDAPLLLAISTQAATDGDLFSDWLDKARDHPSPRVVSHLYAANESCELSDRDAWAAANPALGVFRSEQDMEDYCKRAIVSPAQEQSFRWLFLNQRVSADAPYISRGLWDACAGKPADDWSGAEVFAGLDLSAANDLTAFVRLAWIDGELHVRPLFWLPGEDLREKARADRVPYDVWHKEGHLVATPGRTVDYDWVAPVVLDLMRSEQIAKIAFDRWNMRFFQPALERAGATQDEIERFVEFGQGFQSMTPALRAMDGVLLNGKMRHGGHPVLSMCAANAVVKSDPAGNRKLVKLATSRRIDGMIALAMAVATAGDPGEIEGPSVYEDRGVLMF